MNYIQIYEKLINRAKTRILPDNEIENHHVIPKCMGGTNNLLNISRLTPEEHYVAHQLLVKIYPDNTKLAYAAKMMTVSSGNQIRSNKLYGWLRKRFVEARRGTPMSAEAKERMSIRNSGEGNPMFGKTGVLSPSYGKPGNMTGKIHSEETKRKMSISRSGINHSTYGKSKEELSNYGMRNKIHSGETKQLLSVAATGEKNHMFGKPGIMLGKTHSDETKIKMSEKRALQTFSDETKQKMSDAWLRKPILTCPHCNKSSNHSGNMGRFHFDKCKQKT